MNKTPPLRPDASARHAAEARQMLLSKPPGSLGRLEELAARFAAWQGLPCPPPLKPAITVFAADHGIAAAGVSPYGSAVTAEMLRTLAGGGGAVCVLARELDARLELVDVGVAEDVSDLPIVHAKVRAGSGKLSAEPAMNASEAEAALAAGRAAARRAVEAGASLLIAGDIGVGSTTASAALICRFTGLPAERVVGRGSGVDDAGLASKLSLVNQALSRIAWENLSGLDTLSEIGGLEIAAMVGFYLEGARLGVPSLLDGFISSAAALCAQAIDPSVGDWLLASHLTREAGHALALDALRLEPLMDLNLRLGEGAGAALCVPLLQLALSLHRNMATLMESGQA